MSIATILSCDGCDAKCKVDVPRTVFFGPWNVDEAVPTGWQASDPYTNCCYCPDCWQAIVAKPAQEGDDE